uniref:Uncharacterized protein n=1 Tax=Gossypium raimondii TaxID=29730 RepID=A0A0D2MXS8_GOSRA|nr:hypothetical protein B456_004G133200 [Gossypium raimondii]
MIVVPTIDSDSDEKMIDSGVDAKREKIWEELLLKDGVYTTQPVYSERKVNSVETNQFNSHIGSSLQEDGVYTNQPAHSGRRVNLVKANNLNGHIGSSLLEDGVYTAKPVYLECRVNSLQEKTTQR